MSNYKKISSLKGNVDKIKIKLSSGGLKNTSLVKKSRKEIARIYTEINDKVFSDKIKKNK